MHIHLLAFLLLYCLVPSHATADECVRGEPAPIFKDGQAGLRDHRFVARSTHAAIETLTLESGETVTIEHDGCEYVVASFHISGERLFKGTVAPRDAYVQAARLLRQLHRLGNRAGFDLALAARTLEASGRRKVPYGEPVAVDGDGVDFLQAQVQLDGAGRKAEKGFVKVTLLRGPL